MNSRTVLRIFSSSAFAASISAIRLRFGCFVRSRFAPRASCASRRAIISLACASSLYTGHDTSSSKIASSRLIDSRSPSSASGPSESGYHSVAVLAFASISITLASYHTPVSGHATDTYFPVVSNRTRVSVVRSRPSSSSSRAPSRRAVAKRVRAIIAVSTNRPTNDRRFASKARRAPRNRELMSSSVNSLRLSRIATRRAGARVVESRRPRGVRRRRADGVLVHHARVRRARGGVLRLRPGLGARGATIVRDARRDATRRDDDGWLGRRLHE